jgi:tRNA dimethylallyltransferase
VPPAEGRPRPLAITGPTASGKSALALALAERQGGWIINADALQVYRDLRILSARPTAAEEVLAPHRLFGLLDGSERCSVARWLDFARQAIAEAEAAGARPILCGGTGLYLKALEDGLAAVPPVPAAVLAAEQARLEAEGWAAGLARLAAADPETAARLAPGDRQRILRALAVLSATGRPLAQWQREGAPDGRALGGRVLDWVVLLPAREVLREAVADRWQAMLAAGALEEVRALLARQLDPGLPVMKAVGVAELAAVLQGRADLEAASGRAIDRTRQYLKRQTTWLRTQVLSGSRKVLLVEEKFSGDLRHNSFAKIMKDGLTA